MRLAENERTSVKATIKRASARARADMNRLDRDYLEALDRLYRDAAERIKSVIQGFADGQGVLRLEVLQRLQVQIDLRLRDLAVQRNQMLDRGLQAAAGLGVEPFSAAPEVSGLLSGLSDEAVRFVKNFIDKDGLQLSDRLWRLDRGAIDGVRRAVESAIIQGHSASQAANEFLAAGRPVPAGITRKINAANAGAVGASAASALLISDDNPRVHALRLFRTELNRAHGEAYRSAAFAHPDVIGTRFLLSPRHPEPDICDMHARVNRYGLGPGVYPKGKSPWPAHPNTLSYEEVVFADEITDEDRAGKTDRITWLKGQTPRIQEAVLGSRRKRGALLKGILRENEISTPWRVLKRRYERRGINTEKLLIRDEVIQKSRPALFGNVAGKQKYIDDAFSEAPVDIQRIIEKTGPPDSITFTSKGTSFFKDRSITISETSIKAQDAPEIHDVYRHEYGHYIDYWAASNSKTVSRQISMLHESNGGMREAIQRARVSLYAKSKAQKKRLQRINEDLYERYDSYLADIFGALTKNRVGWGHSKSYLSRLGYPETEVFANMFNLYSRRDTSAWAYLEKELPELTSVFVETIRRWSS